MKLTRSQYQYGWNEYYVSQCGTWVFVTTPRDKGWGSLRHKPTGRYRICRSLEAAELECDRWAAELEPKPEG